MQPQKGIFIEGNAQHWFLEFTVDDAAAVPGAIAAISNAADGASPNDTVQVVFAFGPRLAQTLLPGAVPGTMRPFAPPEGPAYSMPAMSVDLLVWVHSDRHDRNFEVALMARRALEDAGDLLTDIGAWTYRDARDLTGFIDGTENPSADEGHQLTVVPDGPGAGGVLTFTQRWVHNLDGFHALNQSQQEAVIGRTRPDSVELEPVPDDSHVGRVVVEDAAGDELEIYRRSMPYGNTTEAGLFFLAFTPTFATIDSMLDRMVGADGPHDRLMEFSTPVSGAYLFAPSAAAIAALAAGEAVPT